MAARLMSKMFAANTSARACYRFLQSEAVRIASACGLKTASHRRGDLFGLVDHREHIGVIKFGELSIGQSIRQPAAVFARHDFAACVGPQHQGIAGESLERFCIAHQR